MLYKTHKIGGAFFMLLGFKYLEHKGLLIPDVTPAVQLFMMYPAASWASTLPDLDHCIDNVKEQTPVNILIHKLLHLTKPKHRSWQTHSVLVTGGFCFLLWSLTRLLFALQGNTIETIYLRLIVTGVTLGIASHLVLDSLTTAGIYIIPGYKFRVVPKTKAFATGTRWESMIFRILFILVAILFLDILLSLFGYSLMGIIKSALGFI
jgi:membrane-bound metal-dependent hydrolase YbcI (DUF457 family)